jgi:hypothetical protein
LEVCKFQRDEGPRGDGGIRKDALAEGIPANHARWELSRFVRAGGPLKSLIQAGQNPHRWAPPKLEGAREERPTGRGIHDARSLGLRFRAFGSLSPKHDRLAETGSGDTTNEGLRKVQMRRINLDHHQDGVYQTTRVAFSY